MEAGARQSARAGLLRFMATTNLISVQEYLSTAYRPECDYVDGAVVERNVGEKDHGKLQRSLLIYFHERRIAWGIHVFPEQRVQVSATRFRIPDICVVLGPEPEEQIFTKPPFICIEILSPEDRLPAMQERVGDFLRFGVPYVWILDPRTRKAFRCTAQGMFEVAELRTESPEIIVPLEALFED
jgi:Uma2 family endonuclease